MYPYICYILSGVFKSFSFFFGQILNEFHNSVHRDWQKVFTTTNSLSMANGNSLQMTLPLLMSREI